MLDVATKRQHWQQLGQCSQKAAIGQRIEQPADGAARIAPRHVAAPCRRGPRPSQDQFRRQRQPEQQQHKADRVARADKPRWKARAIWQRGEQGKQPEERPEQAGEDRHAARPDARPCETETPAYRRQRVARATARRDDREGDPLEVGVRREVAVSRQRDASRVPECLPGLVGNEGADRHEQRQSRQRARNPRRPQQRQRQQQIAQRGQLPGQPAEPPEPGMRRDIRHPRGDVALRPARRAGQQQRRHAEHRQPMQNEGGEQRAFQPAPGTRFDDAGDE
jgi:hypothetical protein